MKKLVGAALVITIALNASPSQRTKGASYKRDKELNYDPNATQMISSDTPLELAQQSSSSIDSPALKAVADQVAAGQMRALDQFWANAQRQGTPIIESISDDPKHVLATFVWRGDDQTTDVVLMAQPDGIAAPRDKHSHLSHLAGTNIWYRSHKLPMDAEFSYLFSVNPPLDYLNSSMRATMHEDPLNPLQYRILSGPIRSVARMPGVPANLWIEKRGSATGAVHERSITSRILKKDPERQLWIYTTPGQLRRPSLLLMLDGLTYTQGVPTPEILDNLYAASKIGPTIAVFVKDGRGDAWLTDMYFSDPFIVFLTDELLPWLEREYQFKADPVRTVIGGDSIAGLTAAFAALRRPDVFGKVLSQSGSFWLNNHDSDNGEPEWLARQFLHGPKSKVTFCLDVGQMEFVPNEGDRIFPPFVPGSTSLLASNRHLRDLLQAKGYRVHYIEVYGDHEPLRWRRTLPEALIATLEGT